YRPPRYNRRRCCRRSIQLRALSAVPCIRVVPRHRLHYFVFDKADSTDQSPVRLACRLDSSRIGWPNNQERYAEAVYWERSVDNKHLDSTQNARYPRTLLHRTQSTRTAIKCRFSPAK